MIKERRNAYFDTLLNIEAYQFEGLVQKFPNHFHDYYVIGYIEKGQRLLKCNNEKYIINPGDVVIFNPNEPHECVQIQDHALYYNCLNISVDEMKNITKEIKGYEFVPTFNKNVIFKCDFANNLCSLHKKIVDGENDFEKEEMFLTLMEDLLFNYCNFDNLSTIKTHSNSFEDVCNYMEQNYNKNITLIELSQISGLSKYHFIREFSRIYGISPYRYIETIRINKAKNMLEKGILPLEVSYSCGFNDQSHFTNFFKKFIGLTPRQYHSIFLDEEKNNDK